MPFWWGYRPSTRKGGNKALSDNELQKDYFLCTFPVSNTNFFVKHVNDVIDACTKLINLPGGSVENRSIVHLQRGAMYRRLGKYKLALADFTMSIHYDPKSAYAYTGRGNAHRGLHEIDEAIEDHTKAIELKPDYAEAYNNRGNAWRDKKDNKRAMADYDEAIKINPHYALATAPILVSTRATTREPSPTIARRSSSTRTSNRPRIC